MQKAKEKIEKGDYKDREVKLNGNELKGKKTFQQIASSVFEDYKNFYFFPQKSQEEEKEIPQANQAKTTTRNKETKLPWPVKIGIGIAVISIVMGILFCLTRKKQH